MANPVVSIGPQGSGRYAPPNFAPLAQGMAQFGAGIGEAFRQQRERAEKERANAVLKSVFAGAKGPADLLTAARNDPSLLDNPRFRNFMGVMQAIQPGKRRIVKGADGFNYYADTMERVLPGVKKAGGTVDRYEPVLDDQGNIVGQKNLRTGKVETDPRAGKPPDLTTLEKNLISAGYQKGTLEFQEALKKQLAKSPSEFSAMLGRLNELDAKTNRTPAEQQEHDALVMRVRFGGKPPEAYVKARSSLGQAREALSGLYGLMQRGRDNPLDPGDRKVMGQYFSSLKLAFADLLNRGANFTDTEQALIGDVIGGDPNDLWNRFISGDKEFIGRLRTTANIIETRANALIEAYTKPHMSAHTYPWQREGAVTPKGGGVLKRAADAAGVTPGSNVDRVIRHVTGKKRSAANKPTSTPAATRQPMAPRASSEPPNFSTMSDADFDKFDISGLKGAAVDAYIAELERRNAATRAGSGR